jgi:hypothetical protein
VIQCCLSVPFACKNIVFLGLRVIVQILEVNAPLGIVQTTCAATCCIEGSLRGYLVCNSATAVALLAHLMALNSSDDFMRAFQVAVARIVQQLVGLFELVRRLQEYVGNLLWGEVVALVKVLQP